jgi:hypothetical protein
MKNDLTHVTLRRPPATGTLAAPSGDVRRADQPHRAHGKVRSRPEVRPLSAHSSDPLPPPLPTFIIIGAQKSATRWLRHNLGLHPEVFTASFEVKYFNHPKRCEQLGPVWYRHQFAGWDGEPVRGEATPGYLMWRHRTQEVADRIDHLLPDVRLLAILRDPVDRAQSALIHHIRQERVHPRTRLVDWVRHTPPEDDWLGIVAGGWYARSLEPYIDRFGDRLLILLHDEVATAPEAVYDRALDHVGATAGHRPPRLADVHASNRSTGRWSDVDPTEAERLEVFECFRDDIARLEGLIGQNLDSWRPAPLPTPAG